jgi:hypothetical protein
MAGNMYANVNQMRRQDRWNNTTINGAYLANLSRELVRSMADFPTYGRFFLLHVPPLTHLPVSARSCSWRSANDMTNWRRKNSVLEILFNLPSLKMHLYRWSWWSGKLLCKTRCSWWISTPAIPFGNIQSFLIHLIWHSKGKSKS